MVSENPKTVEHPWLDDFAANPRIETARLLAGVANVGAFGRADPSDAATLLFGVLPQEDRRRRTLGYTLVEWLGERRSMAPRDRAIYGLDPFVREVSDAFRIVWRLGLVETARQVRKDFEGWDSWARPLMLTPARDARNTFLRMCAIMQVPLGDSELEPVWLSLCQMAGRQLFPAYLDVGLLGLRRMPTKDFGADPLARAVLGLAVWAKSLGPSRVQFLKEWRALKSLYVRPPGSLVQTVDTALEVTEKGGRERFQASEWWRKDLKIRGREIKSRPPLGQNVAPTKERADDIVRQLGRFGLTPDVLDQIESIMREHERYAAHNFDGFFLVRGAGVLAAGLLAVGDKKAIEIALRIVRRALQWDMNDAHKWSLWQQALSLIGDRESAEYIGWEAIRRFPENPVLRTQLSGFLGANSTRHAEAWSLITETVNRFPESAHSWTQFALLMRGMPGRNREAEGLLRKALNRFPENLIIRKFHASVLLALGKTEEAGRELDIVERNFDGPPDAAYYAIRSRWAFLTGGVESAKACLIEALHAHPGNVEFRTKLAALQKAGTIDDDELTSLPVADDVDRIREELFEAAVDITKTSDQLAPGSSAAHAEEDAAASSDEEDDGAPTRRADFGETSDGHEPSGQEGHVEEAEAERIDEAASNSAIRKSEMPPSTRTQRVELSKSVESEKKKLGPEKQKQVKLWAAPLTGLKYDPVYIEAIRYGRTKRIDYALNGAGLDEKGKEAAREDLEHLLSETEAFGYGYLVSLRRVNSEMDDLVLQGLGRQDAISIQRAWQRQDAEKLNELAAQGWETLLAQCAAALLGGEEAREQFAILITSHPRQEGRGSSALRSVLGVQIRRDLESSIDGASKTAFEVVEELVVDDPYTVTQALTEAIDATFDYFGTERWVNAR